MCGGTQTARSSRLPLEPWFPLFPRLSLAHLRGCLYWAPHRPSGGQRLVMTAEPVIWPLAPECRCPSRDEARKAGPQPGVWAGVPSQGTWHQREMGVQMERPCLHPDSCLAGPSSCLSSLATTSHSSQSQHNDTKLTHEAKGGAG